MAESKEELKSLLMIILTLPPIVSSFSNIVTSYPLLSNLIATQSPPIPAPITMTFFIMHAPFIRTYNNISIIPIKIYNYLFT